MTTPTIKKRGAAATWPEQREWTLEDWLRLPDDGLRYEIIDGAPDLVVEILSPSNWVYDRSHKQKAYEQARGGEHWIVDYRAQTVDVLVLEDGEYVQRSRYAEGEVAASEVLAGFPSPSPRLSPARPV